MAAKPKKATKRIGDYNLDILPSGSLRLRKTYKGENISLVFDYEPTKKELVMALAKEMDNITERKTHMTFFTAVDEYIALKNNVLSPTTIAEYRGTAKRLSKEFTALRITAITSIDVQKEINALAKDRSPKTVSNYYGVISTILATFRPNFTLSVTLPQKIKKRPYIPSDEDVKRILQAVENTDFEIAIILGCYGLRRSEICGINPAEDIIGNTLYINHVLVKDENNNWLLKEAAKTEDSSREVFLPDVIIQKMLEQGYAYKGHPGNITKHLHLIQKKLGIPSFPLHKLRHYFASKMSALSIPDVDILKMGGWKTDHVMKTVYLHSLMTKNAQQEASDKLKNALFS